MEFIIMCILWVFVALAATVAALVVAYAAAVLVYVLLFSLNSLLRLIFNS